MVDSISNVKSTRETGVGSRRSPSAPAATPDSVVAVEQSRGKSTVRLALERDGGGGGYVYKLIDGESGETLRQWPAENALAMREYFRERQMQLVDQTA